MPDPSGMITGYVGSVLIGAAAPGAAIAGKLRRARIRAEATFATSRGAGLDWKIRSCTGKSWEVTAEYEYENPAANPVFEMYDTLLNSDAYIAVKRKTTDTNAFFAGVGMLTESSVEAPSDELITGSITVTSSKGGAPTVDTTPVI